VSVKIQQLLNTLKVSCNVTQCQLVSVADVIVTITSYLAIQNHTHAHTHTTVLRPFVRDYPGEPVPEETRTHPPS